MEKIVSHEMKRYRVSHETFAKLWVVIHWLISSEKYYISMGWNLNFYVVTMNGKGGNSKKRTDYMKLF
jgi:hypothetical protein